MIALSLLMVLIAAGSLVATVLGAGRDLVWVAIGAAVLAIASVAVAVLRRRGQALEPETRTQPGAATGTAGVVTVDAPPWPPRLRPGDRLAPAGSVPAESGSAGGGSGVAPGSYPASGFPGAGPDAVPAERSASPGGRDTDRATVDAPTGAAPDTAMGDSAAAAGVEAGDPEASGLLPDPIAPPPDEPAQEQLSSDERDRLAALARAGTEPRSDSDPTPAVAVEEVVVVDGRPRFHRPYCSHLTGRTHIALPLAEALELSFTPCAWCRPAAYLLASAGPPGR